MAKQPIDSIGVAATAIGGILVYAGIKGYSMLAVIQNLVSGKPITENVDVTYPLSGGAVAQAAIPAIEAGSTAISGSTRSMGQSMAATRGWIGAEWQALEQLWTRESNWNPRAKNPSSGAYGIPQALPHTKMPKLAWPESAGGASDAATQIQWGLSYIQQRYGSPSMAWAFWQRNNWY